MSRVKIAVIFLVLGVLSADALILYSIPQAKGQAGGIAPVGPSDADLPPKSFLRNAIDKATYLQLRAEHVARLRGIERGRPIDPALRSRAIEQFQQKERSTRSDP